ncbi:MAG: putative Ig domain-containing protein [Planctomycetota bacterium]|nr:putative Ig domain-containing protein [Planctomycetota bacterium]
MSGNSLAPDAITGYVSAVFHNPNRLQFTYDLVFLAKLNEPPVFTSTPVVETSVGRSYTYDANATDPDGDTLTYSLVSAPQNLQINPATGVIAWLPAEGNLGAYTIIVRVADGRGGSAEQRYLLSVTEAPPNRPPLITSLPVAEAEIAQPYQYDVDAVDSDLDPITYSLIAGPQGMQIDSASGLVTWAPTSSAAGDQAVTVQASDGRGATDQQTFVVRVQGQSGNHPPVIVSEPVTAAATGDVSTLGRIVIAADEWAMADNSTSYQMTPEDPPNDPTQFALNVADWFLEQSGKSTGHFLAYSTDIAFAGTRLAQTMSSAGHTWTVGVSGFTFDLAHLRAYDGVFLAGDSADNQVLIDYVQGGGNVYLAAGTGYGGAQTEAAGWRVFLNHFGLDLANAYENKLAQLIAGNMAIDSPYSIFAGVDHLAFGWGQEVLLSQSSMSPYAKIAVTQVSEGTNSALHGIFGVFDPPRVRYQYAVDAVDPDNDTITYSLVTGPQGMSIAPASGLVSWSVTSSDVGPHSVTVRAGDGRGGFDLQMFIVDVTAGGAGEIRGTKYFDRNSDGTNGGNEGRVVVAQDVNTLSTSRAGAQEELFAVNVAKWLRRANSGRILAVKSADSGRDYSPGVENALRSAGFDFVVTNRVDYSLDDLSDFDAVFVGETSPKRDVFNNQTLVQYVKQGGSVYLFGGVDSDATGEAAHWSQFLQAFGFRFDTTARLR